MFTGLVQDLGTIARLDRSSDGTRLTVRTSLASGIGEGDSVAVNGVCLTAARADGDAFDAEAMNETLVRSSLGSLEIGTRVNLELPLRAGDPIGGHIVQGHVDGIGEIVEAMADGFARKVTIGAPPDVLRYIVEKGSITVDGVSLTVSGIDERSFTVSLIPETLERTNLGVAEPGTRVNLEVDVLAKYVEKLVAR